MDGGAVKSKFALKVVKPCKKWMGPVKKRVC